MRAMRAEWHDKYTLPSLWKWYQPSRAAHGAYWFDWTTQDEIEWKNNYRIWMQFLNDFKNRGGRVTTVTGVQVLDAAGKYLGTIKVPRQPANAGFAGPDKRVLYITAREGLYRINMLTQGPDRIGK